MFLKKPQEIVICSGEQVKKSGFYEPIEHKEGECKIIETNLFLDKGSKAPQILSCQHNVKWRFKPHQQTF